MLNQSFRPTKRLLRLLLLTFLPQLLLLLTCGAATADTTATLSPLTADSLRLDSVMRQKMAAFTQYETEKQRELDSLTNALLQRDSSRKAAMLREIDSLKKVTKAFPVIAFRDTLFLIYSRNGTLMPEERAKVISQRIATMYQKFVFGYDSIATIVTPQSINLAFRGNVLVSVTDYDAMWLGQSKSDIAQGYKRIIIGDLAAYTESNSLLTKVKQFGLTLLVIILFITFVRLLNYAFTSRLIPFLAAQKDKRILGVKVKEYQFLTSDSVITILLALAKALRVLLIVALTYGSISTVLSIYPQTQRLADLLLEHITEPLAAIGISTAKFLPSLIFIIAVAVLTRYVLKFLRFVSDELHNGNFKIAGFYPDWAKPTFNIIRILVLAFMVVIIFPSLPGSNSPVFQGVSVFIGVLFTLGSSSVINNLIAGLAITYMRPFKVGDKIKIGELEGDVYEKTPFVVRVKTLKKEYITVPNSTVLSSNVMNYSTDTAEQGLLLYTEVTIGYDAPWRNVHQALIDAALQTPDIERTPAPFVLQKSLDDFYVTYQLNALTKEPNEHARIYSALHQNIQDVFAIRGIEIMSPNYEAQRDGFATTIPPLTFLNQNEAE